MTSERVRSARDAGGGVLSGGLLALITIPIHLLLPRPISELVAVMVLAGVAAIDLGFAIAEGNARSLLLQSMICLAFIGAASASSLPVPRALPVFYILHRLQKYTAHAPLKGDHPIADAVAAFMSRER